MKTMEPIKNRKEISEQLRETTLFDRASVPDSYLDRSKHSSETIYFMEQCRCGEYLKAKEFLHHCWDNGIAVDIHMENDAPFRFAAHHAFGHHIVKMLFQITERYHERVGLIDIHAMDDWAFRHACVHGNPESSKMIYEHSLLRWTDGTLVYDRPVNLHAKDEMVARELALRGERQRFMRTITEFPECGPVDPTARNCEMVRKLVSDKDHELVLECFRNEKENKPIILPGMDSQLEPFRAYVRIERLEKAAAEEEKRLAALHLERMDSQGLTFESYDPTI